ncbi:hypothetical protein [Acanthopleuribacter pedis]|uniref:TRASH domain-containing protein n=1 Tax=Acanthopleuribacter pedis TaxID=442870 RepID=A0A8J7Q624_9BACT|nr:hypothetical protein [Acanthopleuribacter pedis]MBO1319665.1 hypothetical protein [Acanthopleuribacter pedis]
MTMFLAVVAFLVAATYLYNSETPTRRKFKSFTGSDDPFRGRFTAPPQSERGETVDKGKMLRCHNCSCFFPATRVTNEVVEGHILEFCSENCRHNFHQPKY